MSSPWKKQPEDVVDSVLKRAEVSKVSLQGSMDLLLPFLPVFSPMNKRKRQRGFNIYNGRNLLHSLILRQIVFLLLSY